MVGYFPWSLSQAKIGLAYMNGGSTAILHIIPLMLHLFLDIKCCYIEYQQVKENKN
jgi:hypothetical protein